MADEFANADGQAVTIGTVNAFHLSMSHSFAQADFVLESFDQLVELVLA